MKKKKRRKNKRKNENKDQTIIKTRIINNKKKNPKAHAQLANRHFCPLNTYQSSCATCK